MASLTENWSISDYMVHFQQEVDRAAEPRFKDKFKDLASEINQLDVEFMNKTKGCDKNVDDLIDRFHSLTGRLGYCERPRGYEKDCDVLYRDVESAIGMVRDLRKSCTS